MEAPAQVRTRVERPAVALEHAHGPLRFQEPVRVQRVAELAGLHHQLVADGGARVDGGEPLGLAGQRLQPVHVVGHRDLAPRRVARRLVDVPAGPGAGAARHDPRVRVQDHLVAVVLEAPKGVALRAVRVPQERERGVRVRGHDHGVVSLVRAGGRADLRGLRPVHVADHVHHRIAGADGSGGKRRQEAVHVGPGAARHGPPGVRPAHADEPVVVHEPQEVVNGVLQRPPGCGGPDGRGDRHEEVLAEMAAEATVVQVLAQGEAGLVRSVQDGAGVPVEAEDVREHAQIRGPGGEAALGEEAAGTPRAELHVAGGARGAERHVAALGLHAQLVEQAHEARIRGLVVDDEPGVHVQRPRGTTVHAHRGDVPADLALALVERHVVALARQRVRRGEAAHPAANHGHPHSANLAATSAAPAPAPARWSRVARIPPMAFAASFRNVPPRSGSTRRIAPPRRMSAT